jgi:hypothetical protein
MGIFGEYDNSCTGEGMPSPYNQKQNLTDKSEFAVLQWQAHKQLHIRPSSALRKQALMWIYKQ